MFKLAFRNIFRNRLRTSLTLAAIVTGVIAIIISGGFIEDVFVQLRESTIHSRLGHIQIFRQGYLEHGRREPSHYLIDQPENIVAVINTLPHVQTAMARINFSGLANNGQADLPIIGEGVEPDKEELLGTAITMMAGRSLQNVDEYGIVIGEGVATALNLRPGSYTTLVVNTLEGALNTLEFEVIGIFRTFSKEYDDRAVRISYTAANQLLFTQSSHSVVVLLDRTEKTEQIAAILKAALEPQGYEVKTWLELADFYQKTEALYRRQFGALQIIILVMLVLSVVSTINMTIYERTGEFGTMLALGSRQQKIFRLILLESTLLGLIGGLLGVVIGAALAILITEIGISMPPPPGSNIGYIASIRLVPWVVATALLTGILASMVAAITPARRASRLKIVDALRHTI